MFPIELVNLTWHPITFYNADGTAAILTLPPSGEVARAELDHYDVKGRIQHGAGDDAVVLPMKIGVYARRLTGLPAPRPGVRYIVSFAFASFCPPDRVDVFVQTDPVRDAAGQMIGSRGVQRIVIDDDGKEGR